MNFRLSAKSLRDIGFGFRVLHQTAGVQAGSWAFLPLHPVKVGSDSIRRRRNPWAKTRNLE